MDLEQTSQAAPEGSDGARTFRRAINIALARLRALPPEIWVLLFYLVVAVVLTWPVITHFASSIYGKPGDNMGAVWLNWWYKNHSAFGGTASFSPMIGYPFGTSLGFPVEPLWYLQMRFLLLFTSAPVAWNIDIVASFFLSGVTMYYLVRYLTRDRRIAFFGGFVYLIGVFHAYYAMWIGGGLSATQWMPLYILMLLKFLKKPQWRSAIYLALSGVLVASTSIHFGFFMAVFTIAFLIGRFVYSRVDAAREAGSVKGLRTHQRINSMTALMSLVSLFIVVVCVLPFFTLFVLGSNPAGEWSTSATAGELRSPQFIYYNSAAPGEYLLPSKLNPVFGDLAAEFTGPGQPDFGNAIYLGWVVVLLTVACAFLWRRKKPNEEDEGAILEAREPARDDGAQRRFTAGALWGFALAAATAFLFSLRPYVMVGSIKIPLPSKLFSIFAPWFRWYSRLAIVVSICLIVIACFGLKKLLEVFNARTLKVLVLGLALALVTLEMTMIPPARNVSFANVPPVFKSIREAPKGTSYAFYPMKESGPFITSQLMFYQTIFQKPMLNGGSANSDGEAMRRTVYSPYDPATPGILRRLGIDYLVFFMGRIEGTDAQLQDPRLLPEGLKETMRFAGKGTFRFGRMYKVTAAPADVVPLYLGEISVPYIGEGGETTRLVDQVASIKLLNYRKRDARISFRLPIANPFTRREVVIEKTNGEVLWRAVLDQGQAEVAQIDGLVVPRDGMDLNLRVAGQSYVLSYQDLTIFAAAQASYEIGDVQIIYWP